ncbi:hypothetical protein DV737_g4305, partial [Chaetothyriales sp. CBS 132003]
MLDGLHSLILGPGKHHLSLDTTIAADVQAQVYEDLGHIENLQWVGLGFPMASAAAILMFTRAYGQFNVKAFYINLPLAGILSPVYIFLFPSRSPRPDLTNKEKLASMDWAGGMLNAIVFVLFIINLSFSGSTYAWHSASSITVWVVFGVCLIAYMVQQAFSIFTTDEERIFPVHFLRSRTLILLYVATGGAGAAQAITLYYTPLFFQFTQGDSAMRAAVRLLPFICTYIFFVMVAGGSLPVVRRYNLYYLLGGGLIVTGGALLFTISTATSSARIYGYEIIVATGTGLTWQNAYSVAVAKVRPKDVPKAIGFINLAQIGTIAISLAIAGSLFQNLGFHELQKAFADSGHRFPDDYIRSALAGHISPVFSSTDQGIIHVAIKAVAETIRKMFGQVVAAGVLVTVSSLLMKFEKISLSIVAGG